MSPNADQQHIVIFDGVCYLCQGAVRFIIKRDPLARFVFAPLQSELAQQLLAEFPELSADTDSVLLIKQQRCYLYSDAALEIARDLSGDSQIRWLGPDYGVFHMAAGAVGLRRAGPRRRRTP